MHKKYFYLYTSALTIFTIILIALKKWKPAEIQLQQDFLCCYLFFALLSPVIYFFGMKGIKSKTNIGFMSFFYGSFMLKLFLSLAFVMIYLSLNKHIQWSFIATFGLGYFLFSGIETGCLMIASKK